MKRIATLLGLLLAATFALADQPRADADHPSTARKNESRVKAQVLAVDSSSKTITVRGAESSPAAASGTETSLTLPVQEKAVASLKRVSTGDTVTLTCRSESTERASEAPGASALSLCSEVTAISKAKATTGSSNSSGVSDAAPRSSSLASPPPLTAEVVAADEKSLTLTVKPSATSQLSNGDSRTLSVDAKAAASLRSLQGGEKVSLTCREWPSAQEAGTASDLSGCSSVMAIRKASVSPLEEAANATAMNSDSEPATSKANAAAPAGTSGTSSSVKVSSKLPAVIVSVDSTARTITVRKPQAGTATGGEAGTSADTQDSLTLPVEGKAAAGLKGIKAGERVTLSCREGVAPPSSSSSATEKTGSAETVTGSASATTKTGDTVTGKGSAVAAADTEWSMAKAGRCAAVTEIAKTKSAKTQEH